MIRLTLLLILTNLVSMTDLFCQNETSLDTNKKTLTVKKTTDFEVTGKGDTDHWKKCEWVEIPFLRGDNSTYLTKVKVLYSDKGMYFLFQCQDSKLTSTITEDFEDLYKEDVVEVFLWSDESSTEYFEYEISPMNYELPILIPNYGGTFMGWLPWHYNGERKTKHETSVTGGKKKSGGEVKSWVAEFFIPYPLLKPLQNVPPKSGSKWRANMYRIDYDNGQSFWSWNPVNKSFHDYENFGVFVFE